LIPHETLDIFGKYWWIGNLSSILFIIVSIYIGKILNSKNSILFGKLLGLSSLIRWFFVQIYSLYNGTWVIESNLPLQMCSFSSLICGIVMFYPNKRFYEFIYYVGIPSAFHAFITPEFTLGTEGYFFYDYYLNHSLIALIPLYLTFVLRFKPRKLSWLTTLGYSQILIIIAAFSNWILNANYMYLSKKPIVNNPFIMGEWPWYIIGLQFAGLIHFIILYIPFFIKNKNKKN